MVEDVVNIAINTVSVLNLVIDHIINFVMVVNGISISNEMDIIIAVMDYETGYVTNVASSSVLKIVADGDFTHDLRVLIVMVRLIT